MDWDRLGGPPIPSTRTTAIEADIQNSGRAAGLARQYLTPQAALPGVIYSIWHNVSGAVWRLTGAAAAVLSCVTLSLFGCLSGSNSQAHPLYPLALAGHAVAAPVQARPVAGGIGVQGRGSGGHRLRAVA